MRMVVNLQAHVLEGLPYRLALPGRLPHLRVDVEYNGQEHVHHEQAEDEHEGPCPDCGRDVVFLHETGPIVFGLHQDLEADTHGRVKSRELLQSPAEDKASTDRKGHEGGGHDDEPMSQVDKTQLQGTGHNTKPRLRMKGGEEADHQEQVVLGHAETASGREVSEPIGLVMYSFAQGVDVRRHIVKLLLHDFLELLNHALTHHELNAERHYHHRPTTDDDEPLQHCPEGLHVRADSLASRPSGRSTRQSLDVAAHLHICGEGEKANEEEVHHSADHPGPKLHEDGLQNDPHKDSSAAAELEGHHELLDPCTPHIRVEEQCLDLQLLGLSVEPLLGVEVVQMIHDEALRGVWVDECREGVVFGQTTRKPSLMLRPHLAEPPC
mmetsp:Transcript_15661/g.33325  ORF Transcript_15661/g.33325 Transcript_15661/m.33325 type:complete len:381 (+) Transcript_15661:565-1707(+)